VPGRGARGEKVRGHAAGHRADDVLLGHVDQRDALNVVDRDRVEGDVQASSVGDDGIGVLVHRGLVTGVDDRRLGDTTGLLDLVRHALQRREGASGQKTAAPSRAKARATARPTEPAAP